MNDLKNLILKTDSSKATILISLIVGTVFLSEGIQKFLFAEIRGAGRFEKMGLHSPEFLGNLVGTFEIVCGILVLLGLITILASIPLIFIIIIALATTKSEVIAEQCFWEMMHGSRTDWAILLSSIFLLLKGGGSFSLDYYLLKKKY